jgi:hypothetical protein
MVFSEWMTDFGMTSHNHVLRRPGLDPPARTRTIRAGDLTISLTLLFMAQ